MATPDRSSDRSHTHLQQQEALADVSQLALSADDLDELFDETTTVVRTALEAEYCAVFERSVDDEAFALRTGSGWRSRTGPTTVSIAESQAGSAMGAAEPVVVDDLGAEPRFSPPRPFVEHDVVSGISVGIGCPEQPWGVLGVYATVEAAFTDHDATFLANVANVLSSAIENERTKRRLRAEETVKERIVETSPIGILQLNAAGEIQFANERTAEILGRDRRRLESMSNADPVWELVDANGEPLPEAAFPSERVLRGEGRLFGVEVGVRNEAGERIWLSVNGKPLRDGDEVTGAILALEDVTDRRRLEHELETTLDRISDAFFALDTEWNVTYVNERASELIDPEDRGLVGENVWTAFPTVVGSTFEREYRRAMETQEAVSFEEHFPPLSTWFEVNAYPSETGLSVYFRDVGERKEMERDRRETTESLQRLHAIASDRERSFDGKVGRLLELGRDRLGLDVGYLARVDAGADRFEVTHASGESEHVSPGAEMPLSRTYCQFVVESDGLLAFTDSPPETIDDDVYDRWGVDCYIGGRVTVDGDPYGTLCFEDEDSRPRPFSDAERTFVELAIQWISYELERKRRSERLERYREYTDDIFDAIDDVFYVVDEGGTLQRWNESACRVTGYADVEVGSMNALEFFDDADATSIADTMAEGFETGSAREEAALRTKNGECVDYEFVASALENPAGEPVLAGVGRDITDRLERERALEESNERLEGFAYAASHDLQEPLRMISSYLTLVERRYADELDDDAGEFIEFAVDGAERMQQMIDGLLEYSRVDTRGDSFEPVDLDEVLEDVRSDLAVKIEESGAEISVGRRSTESRTADGRETVEPLPRVHGDAGQLRQLFQNLLDNALTYAGGEPPRITVFAEKRDSTWAVSVRDDGIGIDPADQDRIFDVFDRLHTREEYDGTGIGLALCRRIAERHGGDVAVDSTPGEGSTFTVTLPTPQDTN